MKIQDALPQIFYRQYSVLAPETQIRFALSLLSFHEIDALPVGMWRNSTKRKRVISGFSCLSKLVKSDRNDYARILDQPCEEVSFEPSIISAKDDVESLLEAFYVKKFGLHGTRFGFSFVEDKKTDREGFITLKDLLVLFGKSIFRTDLKAEEVASFPLLSLRGESTLKQALEKMFERGMRRIFVKECNSIVTEREIIGQAFSSASLDKAVRNPSSLLDAKLCEIKSVQPQKISPETRIDEAVQYLYNSRIGCLICDRGLITPWDVIMKPWERKKLVIL
jgi:predicted transcriptional regulator